MREIEILQNRQLVHPRSDNYVYHCTKSPNKDEQLTLTENMLCQMGLYNSNIFSFYEGHFNLGSYKKEKVVTLRNIAVRVLDLLTIFSVIVHCKYHSIIANSACNN